MQKVAARRNGGVVLDGQTVLHGTAYGGDRELPSEWAALRCGADGQHRRIVYEHAARKWSVVGAAGSGSSADGTPSSAAAAAAAAASFPADQVLLKATWVASVETDEGKERREKYKATKTHVAKDARYIVDRLVAPLRENGLLGYREHLLVSDEPRIRTKLAKFFTEQYIFFPRGVYTNWNWYVFLEWLPLEWLPLHVAQTIRAPFGVASC